MVVTMWEARVPSDRAAELVEKHRELGEPPPMVIESFLLNDSGTDLWRLVTLVRSREELDEMREKFQTSGETPPGMRIFQEVGGDPTLSIFEVITHFAR